MKLVTLLGFFAGTLTTLSFVPQVLRAWRTKRCHDLSWGMLISFSAGVVLWLIYGLLLWAAPIISANAVTLALLILIGVLKVRYRAREGTDIAAGSFR
ncbi:MAG TPA: SemiSWEET transporter [Candidatus Sulfotelmatobacter sp.]|nr:SemiSWEET transporter [Candidatus Sulfotelmatobacter sp.]